MARSGGTYCLKYHKLSEPDGYNATCVVNQVSNAYTCTRALKALENINNKTLVVIIDVDRPVRGARLSASEHARLSK